MEQGLVINVCNYNNNISWLELQKMTREKDKLIDENEQLQQRTEILTSNYEKEKQVIFN